MFENLIFCPKDVLARPAEEFGNVESVEALWAVQAYEHAEIYFNVSDSKIKNFF